MHVHAVISSLTLGGAESLLADFAHAAPSAGVELSVSYLEAEDEMRPRIEAAGVEPELVAVSSLFSRGDVRRLSARIAAQRPDIVHTHLGTADHFGGLAARSLGLPSISTLHEVRWDYAALRARARTRLMAFVRRRTAARILAVSEAARQAYLAAGWDSPERVEVVHNGVRGDVVAGSGAALRARLGIGADDEVVSMIAVLRPGKGHATAIEAIGRLRATRPRLRLLIAGDGPERERIESLATPHRDAIVLAGHVDDPMAVLDASDVLVHPSEFDAFPTTLLEAMAARVPIVASAVGGIPEIVTDHVDGLLLADPSSADGLAGLVEGLLADPDRRRAIAAAGRERYENEFALGPWMNRLRAVYEDVIATRGSA
ncbi:glycosyltransferase family 4 protein [Thermoleophilia bacterium SCSIO 60948]|nr:glycosyltransferase family 4 protein [Thermoleophilia bacterium SCSIO 60948]